jgi:hypothetical protein
LSSKVNVTVTVTVTVTSGLMLWDNVFIWSFRTRIPEYRFPSDGICDPLPLNHMHVSSLSRKLHDCLLKGHKMEVK